MEVSLFQIQLGSSDSVDQPLMRAKPNGGIVISTRMFATIGVAAASVAALSLSSTPASAQPDSRASSSTSYKYTIKATNVALAAKSKTRSTSAVPAAAGVIACTLNVSQLPHNSSHVNGTVNVVETATCTSPVTRLSVEAHLIPPVPYAPIIGKVGTGTVSAQSNAAKACTSGNYQGYGLMKVTFPPGYSPATGTKGAFGPSASIKC